MSGLSPRHEITINTPQLAPGVTPAFPRTGLIQLPMGPDGTATPGVAITIGSPADARTKLGAGSIACQTAIAFLNASRREVSLTAIPVADDEATTNAAWTVTFSGGSTTPGTLYLSVGGHRCDVVIAAGTSDADKALAVEDAVKADTDLFVEVSSYEEVATLTAKNGGTAANDLPILSNVALGYDLPAGWGVAIAQSVTGAGDPTYATTGWGDRRFTDIPAPSLGSGSNWAEVIASELEARFSPPREQGGSMFFGITADIVASALVDLIAEHKPNDPFLEIVEALASPSSPWELAGAAAGLHAWLCQRTMPDGLGNHGRYGYGALHVDAAPVLPGIVAQTSEKRLDMADRDLLLAAGIATTNVNSAGQVVIDRLVTTYATDGEGDPSIAWRDINTLDKALYTRFSWRNWMMKYASGYAIANDGTQVDPGVLLMTPMLWRAEAAAFYDFMASHGFFDGSAAARADFEARLTSVRSLEDLTALESQMFPEFTQPLQRLNDRITPILG